MKVRFLLDENLSPRLKAALKRLDARLDVLRVGDEGAPPLGTLNPDILQYLVITQRVLVTDNRSNIPDHLIWEASDAEEWLTRIDWVPF